MPRVCQASTAKQTLASACIVALVCSYVSRWLQRGLLRDMSCCNTCLACCNTRHWFRDGALVSATALLCCCNIKALIYGCLLDLLCFTRLSFHELGSRTCFASLAYPSLSLLRFLPLLALSPTQRAGRAGVCCSMSP
jgi:hypothetical protein